MELTGTGFVVAWCDDATKPMQVPGPVEQVEEAFNFGDGNGPGSGPGPRVVVVGAGRHRGQSRGGESRIAAAVTVHLVPFPLHGSQAANRKPGPTTRLRFQISTFIALARTNHPVPAPDPRHPRPRPERALVEATITQLRLLTRRAYGSPTGTTAQPR